MGEHLHRQAGNEDAARRARSANLLSRMCADHSTEQCSQEALHHASRVAQELVEKDQLLAEKAQLLADKEQLLAEKEQQLLSEKEQQLLADEEQQLLAEKEQQLADKERRVAQELEQQAAQLADMGQQLAEKDQQLAEKEQYISALEMLNHTQCPTGHVLKAVETPDDNYSCDTCQSRVAKGTMLWGCRVCDLLHCRSCCGKDEGALPKEAEVVEYSFLAQPAELDEDIAQQEDASSEDAWALVDATSASDAEDPA